MVFDKPLFDADNHYYEAEDAFTRYPAENPTKRVRWATFDDGRRRLMIGDRLYRFIADPTFDPVARPGALTAMFDALHEGRSPTRSELFGQLDPINPAYRHRDARLATMDEQGVESAFLLPTLGLTVEHCMRHDVEMTYGNLHAFNRWLDDDWGFAHSDRIFAVPLLSLLDLDLAVAELEWVLERGARIVHLRPGPVNGRSPADPYFDPFWARIDEARVAVAFHASEAGYNELYSTHWGEPANPPSHRMSPFQWVTAFGDRPILDTIAALVLHNLFGRFPNIRVASIEMGAAWVPYLLHWMDKATGLGRRVMSGSQLTDTPASVFREHVYVSPYPEEDTAQVAELIGSDRILLGSDWPHAEGLARPRDYLDRAGKLDGNQLSRFARDNARQLVGLS